MCNTVVKYLWRDASQPSCKELGFMRRSDHPCLNMSARLAKLLSLISVMLPRSCTALARHETTPPLPSSPLPSLLPTLLWLGLSSSIYWLPLALFISCSIPILMEDILSVWKYTERRAAGGGDGSVSGGEGLVNSWTIKPGDLLYSITRQ